MNSQYYNINLLEVFIKWKKHLLIILLVALVASVIFSGPHFITPKYKSFAVVYPSNIAPYSDESESEQILEIFHSNDIRDSVIASLALDKHYRINPQDEHYYTYLYGTYADNIKIKKTPNDAVKIIALDRSPDTAKLIVNKIIDFFNKKVEAMHRKKFKEVFSLYQKQMKKKLLLLDSLKNRFQKVSKEYELLDYEAQSRELARGLLGTGQGRVDTKEALRMKKSMEEKGGEMLLLKNLIENETVAYEALREEYDKADINYNRKFTHLSILSHPYKADKKSYPVRWLIVALSLVGSFFFALVVILIIENYRRMKNY